MALLMNEPLPETDPASEAKSKDNSSADEQIKDAYIADFAKSFASSSLSDRTANDQRACLASCSVFLLGWFNLVEIKTLAEIGKNLVASTQVLTWIAFTLALYFFLRFIGEALIDLNIAKISTETRRDDFIKDVTTRTNIRLKIRMKPVEDSQRKLDANQSFYLDQSRRANAIIERFKYDIDKIEDAHRTLSDRLKSLPGDKTDDRRKLSDEIGSIRYRRLRLYEEEAGLLEPIRKEPAPYPEAGTELDRLLHESFYPATLAASKARYERVFSVLGLDRKRQALTWWLDVILPCGMMAIAFGCALDSLFRLVRQLLLHS
jgi:hypothetical protein